MRPAKSDLKKYDSYIHHLEDKLTESYKHLGIINRQISILLGLNKIGNGDAMELVRFITNSSANLSKAACVMLFKYDCPGQTMNLLSVSNSSGRRHHIFFTLDVGKYEFIENMIKKKILVQGKFEKKDLQNGLRRMKCGYYISLPLLTRKKVGGMLLLGFSNKECLSSQELEFFEAFAVQASFVLEKARALK
jgi:hypothetical protein